MDKQGKQDRETSLWSEVRAREVCTQPPTDRARAFTKPTRLPTHFDGSVGACDEHTHTDTASPYAMLVPQGTASRRYEHIWRFFE